MAFATISFPVPVSPVIRTLAFLEATELIRLITYCIGLLLPTIFSKLNIPFTFFSSSIFSRKSNCFSIAFSITVAKSLGFTGSS